MDTSTLDFNTLTLLVAIMGSTLTIITLMFRQFKHFDGKLDALNTRVGRVETTIAPIDARFDGVDARFDGVDARFDGVDARFDGVDARFDALEARFDKLEARFDTMASDVSDARERLARIEGHLMAPEGFTLRTPQPPAAEDPEPGHRETG